MALDLVEFTRVVTELLRMRMSDLGWDLKSFVVAGRKATNGVQISVSNTSHGQTFVVRDTIEPGTSAECLNTQCLVMLNALHSSYNALKWGDYTAF